MELTINQKKILAYFFIVGSKNFDEEIFAKILNISPDELSKDIYLLTIDKYLDEVNDSKVSRECLGREKSLPFSSPEVIYVNVLPDNYDTLSDEKAAEVESTAPEAFHLEAADKTAMLAVKADLALLYCDRKQGDIYSVLGGTDLSIVIEDHPGERYPKEKYRYE